MESVPYGHTRSLEAVAEVFFEQGYAATSIDAIIEQVCQRHGGTFVSLDGFYAVNAFHGQDGGSSYLGRTDWFHPGDQGHAAMAAAVLSALGAGPAPIVGPQPSAPQIPDVIRTHPH